MKNPLELIKMFANPIVQKARVRRGVMVVLAVIFLLQFYFVRELLAAELFFALGFAVVLALGGSAYLIRSAGILWLENPRRSLSNATPLRALTPRSSWRFQGRGENSEPSEPSMSLEDAVSKRKGACRMLRQSEEPESSCSSYTIGNAIEQPAGALAQRTPPISGRT